MKHPERLSMQEIELGIQRTNTELSRGEFATPEEERDARGYLTFLRDLREKRRLGSGGPPKTEAPEADVKAAYKKLRDAGKTPQQADAELRRRGLLK
jgi:hypothetical protein